jgi:hypothetical protein
MPHKRIGLSIFGHLPDGYLLRVAGLDLSVLHMPLPGLALLYHDAPPLIVLRLVQETQ